MVSNKSKGRDKPPAYTSLQQRNEELRFRALENEAANRTGIFPDGNGVGAADMPIPYMLPHGSPFTSVGARAAPPFSTWDIPNTDISLVSDASQFQSSQNPMTDRDSMNRSGNTSFVCRPVLNIPSFEGDANRLNQFHVHDSSVNDNVTNGVTHFNSSQNHRMGRGNAARGVLMTRQDGETNRSNIHRPQLTENLLSHGDSTPMPCPTPTPYPACGELGINNNALVTGVQSTYSEKIDGNFMTLGFVGNTKAGSKSNISHRDMGSKIERPVFPQLKTSHSQNDDRSFLNPTLKMDGGFRSFQINLGGWLPSTNGLGLTYGASTGFSLRPTLQTAEVDKQSYFFMPSNRNLGLARNNDSRFSNIDLQHDLDVPSLITRNNAHLTPDQRQKHFIKTVRNFSSESPVISPFAGATGSTIRQDQSGNLWQTRAPGLVQTPKKFIGSTFTTGQLAPVEKRNEPTQTSNVLCGPLHKRPAIWTPPASPQVQHRTRKIHPSIHQPIPTSLQIAPSLDKFVGSLPSLPETDPPLHIKEQDLHKKAFEFQVGDWVMLRNRIKQKISANAYELELPFDMHINPAVNIEDLTLFSGPPGASTNMVYDSMQTPVPSILDEFVGLSSLPETAPHHIKERVLDETSEENVGKCFLCKRDLSFTPEGRVFRPPVPPPSAVLPCRHTFHDHCLQLITPEDQARNPPCIPCSLGEEES